MLPNLNPPPWFFRTSAGFAIVASALTALTLVLAPTLGDDHILAVALVYLLATLIASAIWGYAVGLTTAVVADLLVNFFFVPPLHTFTVQQPSNVAALLLFLAVAGVGSLMLSLLRRQVVTAEARRRETEVLLDLSREVASAGSAPDALRGICRVAVDALGASGCAVLDDKAGWHVAESAGNGGSPVSRDEALLATEALNSGRPLRLGTRRKTRIWNVRGVQESRHVVMLPLAGGVLRVSGELHPPPLADVDRLLAAFADEASLTLDRARLASRAREADDLRRADEFKSVLLSSVSHDLRSPLTAIRAAVDSLADTSVDWTAEDRASFLDVISTQTARLTETVGDLLEMSRLEAGVVKTRLEAVDLAALVADVESAEAASLAGRPLRVEVPEGTWVTADYGLLRRAVENLVENAIRYSTPGAAVTIGTQVRPGATTRLTVTDEGPGIPAGDLPHIFEKFYRGAQEGKTKGTGLGLAIVKGMVELCGGTVAVTSSAAGTRFVVDLAAAKPAS